MEASDEYWCFPRITAQNKNIFSNERIILNSYILPMQREENMPMVIGSLF